MHYSQTLLAESPASPLVSVGGASENKHDLKERALAGIK